MKRRRQQKARTRPRWRDARDTMQNPHSASAAVIPTIHRPLSAANLPCVVNNANDTSTIHMHTRMCFMYGTALRWHPATDK